MTASWVPCDCCDGYLCTVHDGAHAADCPCAPVDEWTFSPYEEPPMYTPATDPIVKQDTNIMTTLTVIRHAPTDNGFALVTTSFSPREPMSSSFQIYGAYDNNMTTLEYSAGTSPGETAIQLFDEYLADPVAYFAKRGAA